MLFRQANGVDIVRGRVMMAQHLLFCFYFSSQLQTSCHETHAGEMPFVRCQVPIREATPSQLSGQRRDTYGIKVVVLVFTNGTGPVVPCLVYVALAHLLAP
jgi:hypothetical protein